MDTTQFESDQGEGLESEHFLKTGPKDETCQKAKSRRTLVYGLREVRKLLTLGEVQCVILARDIEIDKIELMKKAEAVKALCVSNGVNIVRVSSKHSLSKAVGKWPIVSAVAVLNRSFAKDAYSEMMQKLTAVCSCERIADPMDQSF
ncbi:unnamed protein product [Thelazia callipaeda]|uniref:Ribosomal_L7Ae domain-containing protein n=1 Tax=Thelazia callipaeda TaxID=103827 RepID=A0A0N5D1C8_THECL|nr:unnamed protein product [Thelazia callipaeda]